jgi:hypothetical protein
VGYCQYGVLARPNQTPFLLRYYPKAIAGLPEEVNRLRPRPGLALEIQPTLEEGAPKPANGRDQVKSSGGRIRLAALRQGKPIPEAVFTAIDSDLTEETVKAGPDGTAVWSPPGPGRYSIYVRQNLDQSGTVDGKAYKEVREFASLAFEWPLQHPEADAEASSLFQEAVAHRAAWRDFAGFAAEISGWLDGRPFAGKVTVSAQGSVKVDSDDPAAKPWLMDQLESMVMHRLPPPEAEKSRADAGRFRFVEEPGEHPLGRLIAVDGDRMGSSYRVRDHQIMVVNRRMGTQNMTITILDNQMNSEGRFLPHSYIVQYWDAANGRLKSVETVQDRWQRLGAWDLPAQHSVMISSDSGLSVRSVGFSQPSLLTGK